MSWFSPACAPAGNTDDQSLFQMYKESKIELEEALKKADSRDGLALKIRLAEGSSGGDDPYADVFSTSNDASAGF